MSEVIEGILVKSNDLSSLAAELSGREIGLKTLNPETFLVYEENSRSFSDLIEELAVEVSKKLNKALLIRYDSRAGFRYSAVYEVGSRAFEFGEKDEIFVLLDEEGNPIKNGARFNEGELDPDEEYETILNAIQLGLEKMDIDPSRWDEMLDLLSQL